jgi:serine/threonine protein kinase
MELVFGTTLRSHLGRGRIAPQLLAEWFGSILDGVAYAHRHGVVHRDLKPENIVIASAAEGGTAKILDFGLARSRFDDQTMTNLTGSGTMVGTLAYMAPEQLAGQPADERSDIFAIGVMLAEALLGAHPFARPTVEATLAAIATDPIRLPPMAGEVQLLLNACVAKTPGNRLADCIALKAALIPALKRCPPFELDSPALTTNDGDDEASTRAHERLPEPS